MIFGVFMTTGGDDNGFGQPIDNNEVYDEVDYAQMQQLEQNTQSIQKIREALAPETHPDFDGETCVDCGNDIPKQRLAMGKVRCVYCQNIIETKQKMYGHKEKD